jgi:endonuclease-8
MPEGDTIYRAARSLEKAIGGRVVTGFETGFAKLASVNDDSPLVGRIVERVEARGKWCLMFFSGDLILASHMLMSGSWHIYRSGEKWFMPRSKMRVAIACGPMQAVLFNAQIAEFHTARSLERSSQVPKLGPDILSVDFTIERGVAAMRTYAAEHPEAEVAVVLLNQRVVAGLGNVYKSEVAFAAEVNPFRPIRTITEREMTRMMEFAERTMRANVLGTNARGESGEGIVTYTGPRRTTRSMDRSDRTWVYGRQGQECRRCGAAIMMRKQGTAVRSTYWCPSCQPWITAEGQSAADGQSQAAPVGRAEKLVRARRKIGC